MLVAALGCASLVGIGELTVSDAASTEAAPPEAGGCGWPGPTPGLVGYYAFEEQSGDTTADCSDSGHPADLLGNNVDAGWWNVGAHGGSVRVSNNVNGVDWGCMALRMPDGFGVARVAPFSISAFIRLETNPTTNNRWVLARTTNTKKGFGVTLGQDGSTMSLKIFGVYDGGGDYTLSLPGAWLDGYWHRVIITVPEDAGATLAVDDASVTDTIVPPGVIEENIGLSFGCRSDGNYTLLGAIDEVRVYDHVLTTAEIDQIE